MGGGGKPKKTKKPVQVSYKKDKTQEVAQGGSGRRALGSQFLNSRKATQAGGGFGGTKPTLG